MSFRHEFVFVKTKKTAGTSIELALSSCCGPRDVITWLMPEEEALRAPGPGPQNFRYSWPATLAGGPAAVRRSIRKRRPPIKYRPHSPASSARAFLGPARWGQFLTFAVERNPFDRAVSYYHWTLHHQRDPIPISAWLEQGPELSNFPLYSDGVSPIVDRVLRFEHLEDELRTVCDDLGIRLPPLPRAKSRFRPAGRDHRSVLSRADRRIIEAACSRELELLGYDF